MHSFLTSTVEPLYNEVLGTMKITLLYQVSHYISVKKQRNIKRWDQQNYLVIRGFCYIRPRYNEVPLYMIRMLDSSILGPGYEDVTQWCNWILPSFHTHTRIFLRNQFTYKSYTHNLCHTKYYININFIHGTPVLQHKNQFYNKNYTQILRFYLFFYSSTIWYISKPIWFPYIWSYTLQFIHKSYNKSTSGCVISNQNY